MSINWDYYDKKSKEKDKKYQEQMKGVKSASSASPKNTSQTTQKITDTKSAVSAGAKAGASAAKTALDMGRKAQPNAPKNSQVDEKTGKFRTDNAKNRRQQERRKGGRGYYVNQGNKEAGERISNIVKGTGKQLGSSYMNTASMMYAAPSKGRIRKELHVQSNRQHGTNDRRFVGKTPAEIAAYREKAKQDEAKVDKQYQKIKATSDASAKELQTKASALRQSGAEDLEKAKEGMGALGKFGVDLSSQMLMWGSDAALGAVTGGGALPFMFIRSFGDASMTAREEGATKGQQAFAGLAAGSVEAATEKLFSPFQAFKKAAGKGIADNFAEKASFKVADTIAEKLVKKGMPKNAVYKAVKGTVKAGAGMLEEGSEEALADFAQPLYERSYDKDALKQYGTKDYWTGVARDFGMGAAMSGVLGGGSAVMSSARNNNTKSSEPYTAQEKSQAIQAAKAQSEESDAYKFAQTLEAQQESGKEVLDAQIDDLVQKTVAEEYETNRTMFEMQEAAEKEQRMVAEKAGDIDGYLPKKGFVNEVYGRNLQNVVALRVDNNASRIEQNLINVFHADPETAAVQAKSIARIKTGTATAEDLRVASVDNIPARKVLMRELKMKLPATNAETMKALTEHEAVIRAVQKQSILKEAQQSARAELFQRFTVGMDDTTADIFAAGMEKVQLADMPKFMEAFATYYEGGRVNYNYDQIPIAKAYQGYITEDIKMAAYQAGNQVYLAEQEQVAVMQQQVVKGERTRGTLELSERNAKKLGKEQSNALRMVADVTGKHIVVMDQIDAGRHKDVANGKYQDGVIYISAKSQAPVFDVLKHELTHNLQETAPEAYQELKDYVFHKFYEADKNRYDEMVRSMVERYAASGVELTRAQAEDELLADATDAFFTDYAAISELALENRSLGEKLLDGIRSLLDTFHRLATRSHSEENASAKGKWLEEIDALKEAERLWVKALNESIGVKNEGSQAKYSIKYDNIGQPYVLLDQNVVASKPNSVKMHNYIADLIAEDIGNFYPIIESGQKVYIGKDLPSEFTQSKYTRWLMRNRKKLLNVKNQTSQEIGEIIEIATNRRWEKNLKDKHNKDAKYGFYKYSTRFVISHKSNREAYEATLVIRNDADGHKYLYDITDIKKVDDLHLASTLQESHDYTGDIKSRQVTSTNSSISDSSQKSNSNEKFSLKSPVEESKDLLVVHGTRADKLMKTLKLGGLPMPSLAIIRDSFNHEQFGEISILFDKATIDPQASSDNKVYTGDAWTPTYPQIDYKVSDAASKRIADRVRTVKDKVPVEYRHTFRRISDSENLSDILNSARGETGLVENMLDSYDLKQMYLAETAEAIPEQHTETRKELSEKTIKEYDEILQKVGGLENLNGKDVREAKQEVLREQGLSEEAIEQKIGAVAKPKWNVLAFKIKKYAENGSVTVDRRADTDATHALIDEAINQAEYKTWLEDLFSGIEETRGIYNGKGYLTASGNRRSFEQLHYAETLENVVAAMKQESATGKGLLGGNIIGAGKKELSSIDVIRSEKGRLGTVSEEELHETNKNIERRFHEIAAAFAKTDNGIQINSAAELLIEAIQSRKTKSGVGSYLKREGEGWTTYSDWIVEDMLNLVQEVSELPTQYFEAKPRRAVTFDEIKAVVLPADTNMELKEALHERNINYIEYDGTESDRLQKVNAAADEQNVRFQLKDSEGNVLSKNQQKYFKDSKVRDEQGRLLVMYHGTPEAGFTEFREGTYFTQNKEYADNYQNPGASSLRVKSSAGNPDTYKVFLNIKKPFDTRNSQERAIFESKFYQKWGTGAPLMESGLPDWTDGMDLQEFIEEMGYDYDGLILDEGGTGGFGEDVKRRGLSYVVFDSSQVKNVDNQNPTDSPDIRYQLKNDDIREFNMTKQQALDNMRAVTEMEPVAHLDGSGFEKQDGRRLSQAVMDYYGGNEFTVDNPYLGKIKVGKRGIKSDTQHRPLYGTKIESFKALKEVIANGEIINVAGNYEEKAYDRVMLSAPISIAGTEYYMGVVINRSVNMGLQNYYLHDVILTKKNSSGIKDSVTETGLRVSRTTSPYIILQQLNNINSLTEKDVITDEGRFQLKDKAETPQERISSLEKEVERLKGEFKRSKIAVPDPKQAGREVTKLMDAYIGKRLPVVHQSIMEDMKKLFAEMRKPDGNWNLVDDLCRNVADKIVSNMEVLHDEYWQQYTDLRKSLKNTTLKLDETHWNDVVDFGDLRKAHFGTLSLSKNKGISIDTYYQELAETYPELFDASEYTNEVDQLYNIIDTIEGMRPYTEDYSEGEIAEFADTIAKDVLQLGYDLSQKETFADRAYNEKMEAIEKVKAERNALMKEQRKRANERLEKKDQFYKDKIREIKEKNKDRKDRKYYTSRIEAYSQWLSDSLLRPTETKHIPESYRRAVAEMLDSFDFGTKRKDKYAEKNGPSKKTIKLAALNKAYKEIMAQESSMLEADDEISTLIDDLSVALEGKRFEDLETEQLAGVYRLVKNIRFAISSANKTFSDGLKENISEYAQQVMHETSEFHYKNRKGTKHTMGDFFQWTNTTPRDAFMLMGKTMETLHQNMRNGLDRHINNTTVAMDFVEKLRKQYRIKDWIDDNARTQKFEVGGRTIELVPSQVMSLYCLMKREQAVSHIVAGSGMTSAPIPVIDKKYQKITKAWSQRVLDSSHVMPSVEEVEHIIGTLTKEQREVADALQQFMNETCADWGNETSMKLYGYKKFREKNYFPIKSSDAFLNESFDNKSNPAKIKNVGFTKNTVVNAGNPIVLDDIFNVFTQHVNTMSMYNALVPAITDFERVYNYRANVDGKQVGSVHQSLERAFGRSAIDYISQFMKDVNQNHVKNRDHEMANKLVANYKKAKIGANLRVLVQQPTAFFRANVVMDARYLLAALPSAKSLPVLNKEAKREMQEHCPIARWKSWGFYNTDVARDMRDIFLDKKNIADKLFMDMYGNADDMTWSIIWRAVKKEIEATKPDLKVGSEAYWNAVSDRFSYVVDRTQVVDSVFHRSQIMRKTDLFSKTATSFMAEPTKTWNMLKTEYTLAARDWQAGKKSEATKRISRVTATHLATAAMTGAAAALIDALRGGGEDDDDKDFFEKWLSYAGQGFLDNANPAGLLPGVRDVLSLAQGYDVSRMDMAGFADLVNSLQYWKSDTATTYFALKKTVGGIASLTGLPVGSLWRDVESIARETAKLFVPEEKVEFVMKQLRYNMKDSRNRSKFAKVYAKADENGNSETAKEIRQAMLGSGADSKKWDSSVKTQRQNVIAGQAASLLNKGDEAEAKKLIGSYCMKYDWKFEKVWAKVLEQSAKRKSTFQKAYDDTIGKLIRGEA